MPWVLNVLLKRNWPFKGAPNREVGGNAPNPGVEKTPKGVVFEIGYESPKKMWAQKTLVGGLLAPKGKKEN